MHAVFLKRSSKSIKQQWKISCQHKLSSWLQIRTCSSVFRKKTHYEILGLEKNCTTREIRTAFVKLSKEVHPDRNPTEGSHAKFVLVNEAYTVLVKPDARRQYDISLDSPSTYHDVSAATYQAWDDHNRRKYYEKTGFWDPTKNQSQEGPYYGVKGLQKISNVYIVVGCCIFILIGITMHYFAIRYANRVSQEAQDKKDQLYGKLYKESKERALQLASRDMQIEMFEMRTKK